MISLIHWDIVLTIVAAVVIIELREPVAKLFMAIVGLPFMLIAKALDARDRRRQRAQLRATELELERRRAP